ncbi:MAG: thiamine phosphate synthase [Bacteroidales bacterium]
MKQSYKIEKGLYLIVDPSKKFEQILGRLRAVLHLPISAVQIWDNFDSVSNEKALVESVLATCHSFQRPVIINNRWEWLLHYPLDGVHFDAIPNNFEMILKSVGRTFLKGITCNNDLSTVRWAHLHHFDYISFCSVFPSSTANSCELVNLDVVKMAIREYNIPLFLAGGITPDNLSQLSDIDYQGIVVVSGIMSADDPLLAALKYLEKLKL